MLLSMMQKPMVLWCKKLRSISSREDSFSRSLAHQGRPGASLSGAPVRGSALGLISLQGFIMLLLRFGRCPSMNQPSPSSSCPSQKQMSAGGASSPATVILLDHCGKKLCHRRDHHLQASPLETSKHSHLTKN